MTSRPTQTRLRLVAIGAAAVLTGLLLRPGAAAGSSDAGTDHATTIAAPGAGVGASVTVSRTTDLVNQTVLVTWKGFRATSSTRLDNALGVDTTTDRPVRVYQCRGADPASSSDCYGAPGFRGIDASPEQPAIPAVPAFTYPGQKNAFDATPDGPSNWQDTVTSADGTGEAAIQLFTRRESAALGCSETVRCSLVVVPNYGRDAAGTGDTEDALDAPWAWTRRTVVPLDFQPLEASCSVDGSSVDVEGTPF